MENQVDNCGIKRLADAGNTLRREVEGQLQKKPGTHLTQRKTASQSDASISSINRLLKNGLKSWKRESAPQIPNGAKELQVEWSKSLLVRSPICEVNEQDK